MAGGVRLRSMWIVLALMAPPPCQETNPEFDKASGNEGGSVAESGADPTTTEGGPSDADAGSTIVTATATGDAGDSSPPDSTSSPPDATGPATTTDADPDAGTTTAETCRDPLTLCEGDCVDTMTHGKNCGGCGIKCNPAMEQCVMGDCVPN